MNDTPHKDAGPATLANPDRLLALYYQDIRAIARRLMRRDAAANLLQPTELAHEAAMRLMKLERMNFQSVPHFLAIAWNYREDYARGGQPMLSVEDPHGGSTARQIVLYCTALLPVSLAPSLVNLTGSLYFYGAFVLGIAYLAAGIHAARERSHASAGLLLRVSVIYLPALLGLMTFDKVVP